VDRPILNFVWLRVREEPTVVGVGVDRHRRDLAVLADAASQWKYMVTGYPVEIRFSGVVLDPLDDGSAGSTPGWR